MDISVIVPVYNVEKYVNRCLDSIFSQNFEGQFEVIAINDGSTDNSLDILKKYKEKYSNFKIIEQDGNKSLAVARSTGIKHATGIYILHIDSDDWIKPDMFSDLIKIAKENNSPDVVVFDYEKHNGVNTLRSNKNIIEQKFFDDKNKIFIQHLFMGACWNKMVKNSLLNNLIYGNDYMNTTEDLIYSFEIFLKAKSILLLPKVYYCYYFNTQSLTTMITPSKYVQSQTLVYFLLNKIKKKYNPFFKAVENVIVYLDNFLALEFFKNHLLRYKSDEIASEFLNEYAIFCGEKRIDFINMSYNNKIYSFKDNLSRFGFVNTLKTIVKIKILK